MLDDDKVENAAERFNSEWERQKELRGQERASMVRVVLRINSGRWKKAIAMDLIRNSMLFVYPFALYQLITWVDDDSRPLYEGYIYVGILFIVPIICGILRAHTFRILARSGVQLKSAISSMIFRKSLVLSSAGRAGTTSGQIQNLMSTDAQKLFDASINSIAIVTIPIVLILCLVFLWTILGPISLVGVAVMILLLPVIGMMTGKLFKLSKEKLGIADKRIKLVTELILGIRILKYYSWEDSFESKIMGIRDDEVVKIREISLARNVFKALVLITPVLVAVSTFVVYSAAGNELTPEKVFTAVALFTIMRFPLTHLPMIMVTLAQGMVSAERVSKFLGLDEVRGPASPSVDENNAIEIVDAEFRWTPNLDEGNERQTCDDEGNERQTCGDEQSSEGILRNISLEVHKGQFLAIVGTVGCGKSSLLEAILGEMNLVKGERRIRGTVAYVPQEPFIMHASLKENILFGAPFDASKYKQVIEACCLSEDIAVLPGGHDTEIGERGINLSGGQKARISLARACYHDADIYLLDDPLSVESAVDAHVGGRIYDNAINGGLLQKKTRLFVTQHLHTLPDADQIIVMKKNSITQRGTYEELKNDIDGYVHTEEPTDEKNDDPTRRRALSMKLPEELSKEETGQLTVVEEKGSGESGFKVLKWYLKAGGGLPITIAVLVGFTISQAIFVGTEVWLALWTDESFGNRGLAFYAGIYVALSVACSVALYLRGRIFVSLAVKAAAMMQILLLETVLRYPVSTFDVTPSGRIVNRFAKDTMDVDEMLPNMIESLLMLIFWELGALIIIVAIFPLFIFAFIPIVGLFLYIERYYVPTSRGIQRIESTSRSPIFAHFGETLVGISTIRGFDMSDFYLRHNTEKIELNAKAMLAVFFSNRWLDIRLELINSLIIGFAALFVVLNRSSTDPAFVGLALSSAMSVLNLLSYVIIVAVYCETLLTSVDRIMHYANGTTEPPAVIDDNRPPGDWPQNGVIEFDSVTMRYRENLSDVLKNVSLSTNSSEKIGVVGRTGSGKSSLIVSLFRIVDLAQGRILIDGIDISQIGLSDLRSRIAIVPQDPVLFSGTVRFNLDPFSQYDDFQVWEAVSLVGLKGQVEDRESGLDATVEEYGKNFSVGERQLFCLARALLRHCRIVILDEATSDVDIETDHKIQSVLRHHFSESTVVTIAHRLHTIIDSDRIVVMDKGGVQEVGEPSALLSDTYSSFSKLVEGLGPRQSQFLRNAAEGIATASTDDVAFDIIE